MTWGSEHVPGGDDVFMRVHRNHYDGGSIGSGAFTDRGDGMSVDWEKYGNAHRTRVGNKGAAEYAVIRLRVGRIREDTRNAIPLDVIHTPIQKSPETPDGNQAHCDIRGMYGASKGDVNELRVILRRLARIEVRLEDAVIAPP